MVIKGLHRLCATGLGRCNTPAYRPALGLLVAAVSSLAEVSVGAAAYPSILFFGRRCLTAVRRGGVSALPGTMTTAPKAGSAS